MQTVQITQPRPKHQCGICPTVHDLDHWPSCGANPWEGFEAALSWPSADEVAVDGTCGLRPGAAR